jgi:site-specific DNA-adenine methylase
MNRQRKVRLDMKAPFPWFGGKLRVADLVWEQFGDTPNYIEPFFGSGAVLLGRPHKPGIETVNDKDCLLANFWRALQNDPDAVAHHADWPVNEADQHARHLWLSSQEKFRERMKVEPDFYDPKIAGWWVWGQCIWIGSGWCAGLSKLPHLGNAGKGVHRKLPHLGDAGTGVHRQRPHLGGAGMGVHRQLPHLGDAGKGDGAECISDRTSGTLLAYMNALAERMRRVRVCCGDWSRICGPSPTTKLGITAVFLDPPYSDEAERNTTLYSEEDGKVAHDVAEWAIENGKNPMMRIALCGYEGEHAMPDSWDCVEWKARGGYGSQGSGSGRDNAGRERIWFSPHCLGTKQRNLFGNYIHESLRFPLTKVLSYRPITRFPDDALPLRADDLAAKRMEEWE